LKESASELSIYRGNNSCNCRYRDHKKKVRRRPGGNQHIMWHNITNECLSEIIQKHETSLEQTYTNNVMP